MPPRGVVSIVVEALKPLRRFIAFFFGFYGATSSRSACVRRSVI